MKNVERYAELALRQLDNAGYYLSRYGISDKVNRHNLIALAMTRRERIKGELSRLELRLALQRKQLQQQVDRLSETADHLIEQAPAPVAARLLKAKARIF
jgi:hypothetical protein